MKDRGRTQSGFVSYWCPGPRRGALGAIADLLDVVACLTIRRHSIAKLRHRAFTGVVTSQHEIHTIVETIQQLAQVPCTAGNILCRIVRTSHAKARRSSRHQLHQTARAFRRHNSRIEVRLLLHHQKDQIRIDVVLVAVLTNQTVETAAARAPATRLLPRLRNNFSIFYLDTIDTRSIEEYRHRTALVPNTRRRLRGAVSLDARAAFQIDPRRLVVR